MLTHADLLTRLRILLAGCATLVGAVALSHLFTRTVYASVPQSVLTDTTRGTISMRSVARTKDVVTLVEEAPKQPGPLGLFVGSSPMLASFYPTVFDEEYAKSGAEMTSYNLAIGAADNRLLALVSRRLREGLQREGRTADLFVLEFMPFQAKATLAADPPTQHLSLRDRSLLMSRGEIAELFFRSPEQAATVLAFDALGVETEDVFALIANSIRPPTFPPYVQTLRVLPHARGIRGKSELTDAELAAYKQVYKRVGTPQSKAIGGKRATRQYEDAFDDGLVDAYIEAFHELAPLAKRSYLLLMPLDVRWVKISDEARARQVAVMDRIARETGAKWLDFSEAPEFGAADFQDMIHLHPGPDFSKLLANTLAREAEGADR